MSRIWSFLFPANHRPLYHRPMPETQNFQNHGRVDPLQHFIAAPILLLNFLGVLTITIVHAVHGTHGLLLHIWLTIVSFALLTLAVNLRLKDLVVQDRVIRLEERLRYAALLSPAALAASSALTLPQIIALRFASDAELPALITRTLAENLTGKQIKQSIITWRPDTQRV
jgi:Family of unknown function (DUF6526)